MRRRTSVRVGVIDAHPAFRLGIIAMLDAQRDLRVVVATATVRELIGERMRLDLVLLDLALSDGSTPNANIERLRSVKAPIVVFAALGQTALVQEAVAAGAVGAIPRWEPADRIVDAVRRAAHGRPLPGAVAGGPEGGGPLDPAELVFTEREAQVLTMYASGETADRVADALFISQATVNDHIRRIRAKYAAVGRPAATKVELFRRAVEDGFI